MEKEYVYEYLKKRLPVYFKNTASSLILKRIISQLNFDPSFSDMLSGNKPVNLNTPAHDFFACFIDNYLSPSLKSLNNPFLMSDMEKAVRRITEAIFGDESICIYGDYDVDGITATSFLVSFLREIEKITKPGRNETDGSSIFYKLPDRIKDGYGLGIEPIEEIYDFIKENGKKPLTLMITVDLGITGIKEVDLANSKNIDVIICDHHEVLIADGQELLPASFAILNPKRKGDKFPFKFLPGVGIAFYLGIALRKHLVKKGLLASYPNLKDYLDIVCLGIVADIVPMYGDNRTLTHYGLKILNGRPRPGIKELKRICRLHFHNVNESDIAWKIAPKINAAGRVGNPSVAVELLTQKDAGAAYNLAQKLETFNRKRQLLEDACFNDAVSSLKEKKTWDETLPIIILKGESWHPGIIGIVSSRLADYLQKPVLLLTGYKDKVYIGSARSCGNINIYAFLKKYESFFFKFGGHKMACGLTVKKDRDIDGFIASVIKDCGNHPANTIINDAITVEDIAKQSTTNAALVTSYDEEINLDLLTGKELSEIIKLMSPFGPLNEQPKFLIRNVTISDINRREFKNKNSKKNSSLNCYFTLNIKDSSEQNNAKHKAMMFNKHRAIDNILGLNGLDKITESNIAVDGIIFEFFNGYIKILNFI